MKTISTKKALIASMLSMLICVSMLIGSTFAWFTSSATTSVNTIQAGSLKVDIVDENGDSLDGKTLSFKDVNGNSDILWEPGATYKLDSFKIVNKGNLALKYKVAINGVSGNAKLLEIIDFTMKKGEVEAELADFAGVLLPEGATATDSADVKESALITISGHMREDAGNDYMNETLDGISITVIATQYAYESDSSSSDYDADAEYPATAAAVVSVDESNLLTSEATLVSAVEHEATGKPAITATVPAGAKVEEGATKLELNIEKAEVPANFTVEITQNAPKTLDIHMEGLAADNDKLIKVEFYIETDLFLVEINHNGKAMSRCSAMKWLDADQEFYYDATTGLVTMLTKTFSPFTYTSDKFQWDDKRAAEYATPVDTENKVITVASAEELALFKYEVSNKKVNYSGYTLNITKDIDLGAGFWRPVATVNNLTINGNGHTIKNLLVRTYFLYSGSAYGFAFIGNATGSLTINDLTFDNASVAMAKGYEESYSGNVGAIVVAYTYGTTVFDKVKVVNSTVSGYGKIGCLLGMGATPGISVTFRNCISKDNTIYGAYNLGGLAGNIQRGNGVDNGKVENCAVENVNVVYYGKGEYAELGDVNATYKSNDKADGEDVIRSVTGKWLVRNGYFWGTYGDYYVSYGGADYDPAVDGHTKKIANSEYCVNK